MRLKTDKKVLSTVLCLVRAAVAGGYAGFAPVGDILTPADGGDVLEDCVSVLHAAGFYGTPVRGRARLAALDRAISVLEA